jgi:hypothetical protein
MTKYMIRIIAEVNSSLSKTDLESRLVVSLFDVESEEKLSDGDNNHFCIVDYDLTETIPI